ncbi:hypothetical protein H8N03_25860 [Ramlibacter sp. USB13]|uniref:Uncharacterized protein n=1 Tax=Ramlibacter cellulosilyticus TaxID=2764187 RepID=A0A923MWG0_9BURK|nr:hypothetical protein [Ramlibacter cellulosilyticus]MBC5786390.1 hypothetical protein [Ramlibacter cellulosilyticus]
MNDLIELHRHRPEVTLAAHVRTRRKERADRAKARDLIYLDTNAWKCMADYRQKKPNLTPAMVAFGEALERAAQKDAFAFPIGLPTFFELDSMTHPGTRTAVTDLVDELSHGFCIAPFQDRVGHELHQLRRNALDTPDELADFLCSPIELLGIPAFSLPEFVRDHVDDETFNKAFFDSVSDLPFSVQLQVASSAPGAKWDNSRGIADLNAGKDAHQQEVVNLNTGIFLELKGCIATWFDQEGIELDPKDIVNYAVNAQYHWHQKPASRALPTLRVLSALYGLMRFDAKRRYRDGDPNDFMVAASALPVAHALFTDRKLCNLLSDPRIGLGDFSNCAFVSGFDEMAKFLVDRE